MKIPQSGEVEKKYSNEKNDKVEVCLFIREDISSGSKYLLTTRSLFVLSMAEFSSSIRLWSLGRGFVIALNFIFCHD